MALPAGRIDVDNVLVTTEVELPVVPPVPRELPVPVVPPSLAVPPVPREPVVPVPVHGVRVVILTLGTVAVGSAPGG